MTTTDGSVLGTTQIFGTAPRNGAFNVVLLAEGFTAVQQNDFNNACTAFLDDFQATPPFDELSTAINVFRVNVTSTDSGADDPAAAGGTGATVRTYFDASFGGANIRRLLVCNTTTALQVAAAQVPEFAVVLVVVNSTIYGGSGGTVGTYSLAENATEIAIHEMGHTAFGLADEYAYYAGGNETGHDHHPPGEPSEPNVTTNTDRNTLKWQWAVASTTAIPTMTNPDCTQVDSRPSPVPVGTAGLFEGAHYYHCGAYRPEYDCKMRALGVPFCRVCRQVIWNRISPLTTLPKKVALRAHNGQYVCAEGGGGREVVANRDRIRSWETFELIELGDSKIALRAHNGQYVCAEGGGGREVVANRDQIRSWETFELVKLGDSQNVWQQDLENQTPWALPGV